MQKIATPISDLVRKDTPFIWTELCNQAFETLKQQLTTAPVSVKADIKQPFILETDASQTHVGAVLMQKDPQEQLRVISYFSKKLKPVEARYSTTDREALSIVLACRKFQHYLWGPKVLIKTDHQPLVSIFKQKTKSPRMNRWILEMRDYRYQIQYRSGKRNPVVDHLSRPVRIIRHQTEERWLGKTREQLKQLQRKEPR